MPTGIFTTWDYQFFNPEQAIVDKIKDNPRYPFKEEKNLYVLEYFHGNLWTGSLLLLASIIGSAVYFNMDFKDNNKYGPLLVFSLCLSLWLLSSGAFRRRLVIDHVKKEYRYYIHDHLRHCGPIHQIYIRLIAQKSEPGRLMFKLVLNGYKIEKRELSCFSEKYELLECLGRRIATNLNINFFDYRDISKRHVVVHRPSQAMTEAVLSPV